MDRTLMNLRWRILLQRVNGISINASTGSAKIFKEKKIRTKTSFDFISVGEGSVTTNNLSD